VFGRDITWTRKSDLTEEEAVEVRITGFPPGVKLTWTAASGQEFFINSVSSKGVVFVFTGVSETELIAVLKTLTMTAPPHSADDFDLNVTVVSNGDLINNIESYSHSVTVRAVADKPVIVLVSEDISLMEDDSTGGRVNIVVDPSADLDDSEVLSLRLTVPSDGSGLVVGDLAFVGVVPDGYTFNQTGPGVYTLTVPTGTPTEEAGAINSFFANNTIQFTPRAQWSGILLGTDGIKVELISTETANGYGEQLAPNNSQSDGTSGDTDTKIEIDTVYIGIQINPVNDQVTLGLTVTKVSENNGSATGSPVLTVPIGANMDLGIADMDGSQSINITLSGFPLAAVPAGNFDLTQNPDVMYVARNDTMTTTLTFSGPANEVLASIKTLSLHLTDDLDQDFDIEISGTVTDTNGRTTVTDALTNLTHSVIVRATADEPTINLPGPNTLNVSNGIFVLERYVLENSASVNYPINVTVNDNDGSETIQSVRVTITTEGDGSGNPPIVTFMDTSAEIVNSGTNVFSLTGTSLKINASLNSMQIQPGKDNGEDIIVEVTATAIESNPSEGSNSLDYEDLFFTETANITSTFQIEVIPVIRENDVVLMLDSALSARGNESARIDLGEVDVVFDAGLFDSDGSEEVFVDIVISSVPTGSGFFVNGTLQPVLVVNVNGVNYFRLPEGSFEIQTPPDYSGIFVLQLRGVIVDKTSDGNEAAGFSPLENLTTIVDPIADCISFSTMITSSVVEDLDDGSSAASVGAYINHGLVIKDNGSPNPYPMGANNVEPETISKIELVGTKLLFSLNSTATFPSNGSTEPYLGLTSKIYYSETTNTIIITSTIIENARDNGSIAMLNTTELKQAEDDIRAALQSIVATNSIPHSDVNQNIMVKASTIDVNPVTSTFHETTCEHTHTVVVQAFADPVNVTTTDISMAVYAEDNEDGIRRWGESGIPLHIVVKASADNTDNSETLELVIMIPLYGPTNDIPIGTLNTTGNLIGLTVEGDELTGVYKITPTPTDNTATQEVNLNNFLASQLFFVPTENWSGNLTGDDGIEVVFTTTEGASGNTGGILEIRKKSSTATGYIGIDILPRVSHDAALETQNWSSIPHMGTAFLTSFSFSLFQADAPKVIIKGNAIGYEVSFLVTGGILCRCASAGFHTNMSFAFNLRIWQWLFLSKSDWQTRIQKPIC
jgi:hypothetical protein